MLLCTSRTRNTAFSLVELSIVLVILGLLVGGILSGQALIRAAELRSISTDVTKYRAAIHTFRDKYFGLPGDIPNATSFWGDDNANCPDAAIPNGSPGTCNGNNDGRLRWATPTDSIVSAAEVFRAWQQLSLAGLVEGNYTGLTGSGNVYHVVVAQNAPASRIANGAFVIESLMPYAGASWYKIMDYGNMISFGNPAGAGIGVRSVAIKSEEAYNIDMKMDDGMPTLGAVIAYGDTTCRTGAANVLDAPYTLTSIACALMFRNAW